MKLVNTLNSYGNTPHNIACQYDNWESVEFFLGFRGINTKIENKKGETAFQVAKICNIYKFVIKLTITWKFSKGSTYIEIIRWKRNLHLIIHLFTIVLLHFAFLTYTTQYTNLHKPVFSSWFIAFGAKTWTNIF